MLDKKKILKISSVLLTLGILFVNSPVSAFNNLGNKRQESKELEEQINAEQSQINSYEEQIKLQNREKTDVTGILNELASQKTSVESQINQLNAEIQQTMDKIHQIEVEIIEVTSQIEAKEAEIKDLVARIDKTTNLLRQRLRVSYKMGDAEKIEILLSSNDINDFLSRNKMITTIAEYDKALINSLKEDKARLETLLLELEGNKLSLEISKENLEEEKEYLDEQKMAQAILLEKIEAEESEKYEELKQIEREIESYEAYLNERLYTKSQLAEQKSALDAEIRSIEYQIAEEERKIKEAENAKNKEEARAARSRKEKLEEERRQATKKQEETMYVWPTASGIITSRFGNRLHPIYGIWRMHNGVDIAAPIGTSIYSIADGVVIDTGYDSGGGNYIEIRHSNGIISEYLHLSSIEVSSGQRVSKGQRIGGMGSTGASTGSHLHFGILEYGRYINPLDLY